MDAGRKYDLEEIYSLYQSSKNAYERDKYDRIMYNVINESITIRELRERMIKAFRGGDSVMVKRIRDMINRENKKYDLL